MLAKLEEMNSYHQLLKTVNECIEEDIAREGSDIRDVKFDLETLITDFIMDVLDQNELSEYVESFDIDNGKLMFEINHHKVAEVQERKLAEWKRERDELTQEYFSSKGVF